MTAQGEQQLGGFRIVAPIRDGKGRQGVVYKAVCVRHVLPGVAVGETVALKVMKVRDEEEMKYSRLEERTRRLAGIRHPNVVRYRGCFKASDATLCMRYVAVMELLKGQTLKELLAENPGGLDADEAIRIVDAALAGLEGAAAAGIVHRDIKPANIFLCSDGTVKLIDFEIARGGGGAASTASGRFAGTFDYMAPEFADPSFRGDARSDLFSMGVVLHEALTGEKPYARMKEKGEQADFAFLSRWSQRQNGLCAIQIGSSVERVLDRADGVLGRALAANAKDRYASAAEFRAGLRTIRPRFLHHGNRSYRLLRLVGQGGFGEVFKARDETSGGFVAIKHLLRASPENISRFEREARVMQKLDNPAFVRFVGFFKERVLDEDEAFLVMTYLRGMPGQSLRDAIKRHGHSPLPLAEVLRAFVRYAQALDIMHGQEIYHRDIKPANLYYPTGRPDEAVVMDLGIVRDAGGSITAGNVPGTLDYMPPEIVTSGSRGDAGMDIYALGLCLYEAVSGKPAYLRLPRGSTAVTAFFKRVQSRQKPTFKSAETDANPVLLKLLQDMTALDCGKRIKSAREVANRLAALQLSVGGRQIPLSRPAPPPDPVPDPLTDHTVPTGRSGQRREISPHARKMLVGLVAGAAALAVVVAAVPYAKMKCSALMSWWEERRRTETDDKLRQEEAVRLQKVLSAATAEADGVVRQFDSRAVSALAAENAAGEWQLKWSGNADVRGIFAVQTNRFAVAKAERLARDKREENEARAAKARREANALADACAARDVSTETCKARAKAWQAAWKAGLDDTVYRELAGRVARALAARVRRDKEDADAEVDAQRRHAVLEKAERDARVQAGRIAARYADETVPLPVVKAEYAIWQSEWGKFRNVAFFAQAAAAIEAAAAERALVESGRAVAKECGKWLDNIAKVSADNVKNWRGNLERAELELRSALREKRISEKAAESVRRRIEACRTWAVGVIDNKTHRTVEFGGLAIGPVSRGTVVFTNGVPDGVAVTSEGCEPFRVREDRFDSEVVVVMRLEERKGGTQARIPPLGDDVSCLVDGVERHPGTVELRQGRHRVVYRRRKETYPGVRDFCDQETAFSTSPAGVVDVPPPSSDWKPSQEFEAAKANAGLVARGREIVAQCESNLAPEPLETRRSRLGRAFGILNDWQTASALSVLGEGVERDLRAKYEAERRRIRGYVRNATALPLAVTTDTKPVSVPPGTRAVVTFEREWRGGDAYASVPGYEFVMLPRSADDFDGKEFVVSQEKLVGVPVKVSLPPLEDGVVCGVQGRRVEGSVNLRPGEYEGEYRKPDCARQKFRFTVKVGESLTLPPPGKWEPSGAMSLFAEAMSSFASGAVDDAKAITERIGTIEDPAKRRELEDLKRAIEIREKLEGKSK